MSSRPLRFFQGFEFGTNDLRRPAETPLIVAPASFAPDDDPKSIHNITLVKAFERAFLAAMQHEPFSAFDDEFPMNVTVLRDPDWQDSCIAASSRAPARQADFTAPEGLFGGCLDDAPQGLCKKRRRAIKATGLYVLVKSLMWRASIF